MPGRAFIIGGTGQIGRAAARALLDAGWSVTLAHRGHRDPPADLMARGARGIVLDRKEPGALGQALGHGADVPIDTVAYGRDDADQLLALEGDVGGLVVVSSASVYRDAAGRTFDEARQTGFPELPDPIPETHPTVAPGPETYSTRKIALERRLLDGAKGPVTVLRPCAIHGPHSRHPRKWWFVKRMLDGRRQIPLAYSGNSRFHTTATVNLAAAIVLVADRRGTLVMNVGDPTPLSVMEIGRVIAGRLGYSGSLVAVPDLAYPPAVGATPWSTPPRSPWICLPPRRWDTVPWRIMPTRRRRPWRGWPKRRPTPTGNPCFPSLRAIDASCSTTPPKTAGWQERPPAVNRGRTRI